MALAHWWTTLLCAIHTTSPSQSIPGGATMGPHHNFHAVRHASLQTLNLVGLNFFASASRKAPHSCFARSICLLILNQLLIGKYDMPPIDTFQVLFDPAHPVCFGQPWLLGWRTGNQAMMLEHTDDGATACFVGNLNNNGVAHFF